VDTTLGLVRQAWNWMDSAQLSYLDALIVAAAQRDGARYLLSEGFQPNRRYDEIQVLNPYAWRSRGSMTHLTGCVLGL
jgi:predicted nucleic acid-binding protein